MTKQLHLMKHSALVTRLERYVQLETYEQTFLASLEREDGRYNKGHKLANIGDTTDHVWILKSGWAVLRSNSKTHGSQILRIFLPGEFIGLSEFGLKRATHQIVMQTDGVVTPLCRKSFHRDLANYPRLLALLSAIGNLSLTALHYQVSRLNTMSAQDNLKFFLLQLHSRLHAGQDAFGDRFELPMSQVEIGQVLGLTSIYVNKLLRKFVNDGDLEIERPYFRLKAREEWEVETAFVDAFSNIDTSWFSSAHFRTSDTLEESEPHQTGLQINNLRQASAKTILV